MRKPTTRTETNNNAWIDELTPAVVEKIVKFVDCDGHAIFDPKGFLKAGVPEEIVNHFTSTHESGDVPKYTIYGEHGVYRSLEGIYGLDVLTGVAQQLGVKGWGDFTGRGFKARAVSSALLEWVEQQSVNGGV